MKNAIFIMLFMLAALKGYSQDPWNPIRTYCEVVGTGNLTGTKVKIEIDFGQAQKYWSKHSDNFLVDADGKEIKFNSMVDALNYMARFGWKFEQAYVITENSTMSKNNVYHYLLSKELRGDESVNDGIYIKGDHESEQVKDKPSKEKPTKKKREIGDDIY